MTRSIAAALCILALVPPTDLLGQADPGDAAPLRAAQWSEDIDSLATWLLRTHPRPFTRVDSTVFMDRLSSIRDSAGLLPDAGVAVRLMHLVAGLGDGHTLLDGSERLGFDVWFPLRFYRFTDGLHVTAAPASRPELIGARIVRIGGRPAGVVADSVARVQQTDNALFSAEATYYLSSAPVMRELGFLDGDGRLSLEIEADAGPRAVDVDAVRSQYHLVWRFWGEMFGPPVPDSISLVTAFEGLRPIDFRTLDRGRPPHLQYRLNYHYTLLPEYDAAYMQFNFVNDAREGPDFGTFIADMFADLDDRGVGRFVLDLRRNSGGDGSMLLPFVHAMIKRDDTINRPGRFFVLTGRQTYSAAIMLVGLLREHTNAVFVGEPPGAALNHYGDAITFELPHSGMSFSVSQRYWQYALSDDTSRAMAISVPARFSFADWEAGRDPALEAVLPEGAYQQVLAVLDREGVEAARALYEAQERAAEGADWWEPWDRDDMRRLGQRLLADGRIEDALLGFELNSRRHPAWWRSWEGLADALAAAGRNGEAVAAYRRALEISPGNWNAGHQQSQVAKLSGGG